MARIRTIKPEFFTSEDIVSLSPLARLLYVALWCEADREGRLVWKPRTFKMRYFPADDCDITALCAEILSAKLVRLYGDGLAYIPKFGTHQHVNPREAASTLPDPDAKPTRGARVSDAPVTHREEGKERKGKEGATRRDPIAELWEAWPASERKQDKAKCEEKLKTILKAEPELLDAILADIAIKKLTDKWRGGFIEAPLVYLNGRRWEDGVTPGSQAGHSEAGFI